MTDRPRVLIIEDSPTQAWQLGLLLEDNGYAPQTAPDCARALALLSAERFDLILSDLNLPDMRGFDLCKKIKADPTLAKIPLMILTSETDPRNILESLEAGADGYMMKERDDPKAKLERVRNLLSRGAFPPADPAEAVEVEFLGQTFRVASGRSHLLHVLLADFEDILHLNRVLQETKEELEKTNADLRRTHAELKEANERLHALATTDGLTGLLNHRRLQERLAEEARRSTRQGISLGGLMVDIDFFKSLNDKYGHSTGDRVLQHVAKVIRDSLRDIDIIGRYGGEEFAVLLLEASKQETIEAGERLREAVAGTPLASRGSPPIGVTVSVGAASYPHDTGDPTGLLAIADIALYAAKRNGRNRVEGLSLHRFEYRPAPEEKVTAVALCGDFNSWNRASHPLHLCEDGAWRVESVVPTGRLRYKFHLNDEKWIPDPAATIVEEDIYKEPISVVVIARE